MSGEGVVTRSRKSKVAQRDSLWDLIVNNDDICFQHILPRLNSNDVKFLYGVNTETRKLIERSSREKELKRGFKVKEMSSISTLEFVWENKSLWPRYWGEATFCSQVAQTNKLELLKWAREEKECEWDEWTINAAAEQGNLEMVKYCVSVLSMCLRVHMLPEKVISRCSNTYAKKRKRLGVIILPNGRLKVVIFIYSNTLLSVCIINIADRRVSWQPRTAT